MRIIDLESDSKVAYFSMEVGLDPSLPTYSGGLGILAGDTLRSGADLRVPMVCISLIHRKGYFHQELDREGNQSERPVSWSPEDKLEPVDVKAAIEIDGRKVAIKVWRYDIKGISGHIVPVYFLDTNLKENTEEDRTLTDHLYGGDNYYRLRQETLLGMGGVEVLRKLKHNANTHYHMNEGHSALLTLALLEDETKANGHNLINASTIDIETVRAKCIFTTHTPVPAGHDQFPMDMVEKVLGSERKAALQKLACCDKDVLNMTYLGLFFSRYINGVAMRHGEVSRGMFPNYPINAITNGVHAVTWTSEPFKKLFDNHIAGWRTDNLYLRYAMDIPLSEIKKAHTEAKTELFKEIRLHTGKRLDSSLLTLGIARRATPYKRLDLIFSDIDRLAAISRNVGPIQIIYAGKAHPQDEPGKLMIKRIHEAAAELGDSLKVVYLENYEMAIAKLLCAGVDIWVNTPMRPREASGTSGMKAALNGVPSLSVLDGWWVEGHVEGVTGWSIGDASTPPEEDFSNEVSSLYDKLEKVIIPMYYGGPYAFANVMRSSIAFNGSFFNTQRMVSQYLCNAYFPVGFSVDEELDFTR